MQALILQKLLLQELQFVCDAGERAAMRGGAHDTAQIAHLILQALDVIDIYSGEHKTIILSRSPFGFNFATKVVSLIDFGAMSDNTPSEDNPFGNMWPLLMLNDSGSIDPMMLALMCMGKGDNANPMMMCALLASKGDNDNLLPLMLMMNGGKFGC